MFESADLDQSGYLEAEEARSCHDGKREHAVTPPWQVRRVLLDAGYQPGARQLTALVAEVDIEKNGKIDVQEVSPPVPVRWPGTALSMVL